MKKEEKEIIVIVGPTGVGKTKLSVELAKILDGEIINADSMQFYKDLNIGTAKITKEEKQGVPHHLFDICEVDEDYNIYRYQKDCREKIKDIIDRGKTPILVGGSGLYIKAALFDYNFQEEKISNTYDDLNNQEILDKILEFKKDVNIHVNNRKRLIRELNKCYNNTVSNNNGNKLLYKSIFIGLTTTRDKLYEIINKRVDKMIESGLLKEVEDLHKNKIYTKAISTGIGYKELYKHFDKEITLNEAIELIKKNSRNYAKRQYTFFNHQMEINWFEVDFLDFNLTIREIENFIKGVK
jgi:tRNA dimethylallyltransferase